MHIRKYCRTLKIYFPSLNKDKYHWEWNPFKHMTTDGNFILRGGGGGGGMRMMVYTK
jgi:hypothetical protein